MNDEYYQTHPPRSMRQFCFDLPESFQSSINAGNGYSSFGIRCICGSTTLCLDGEKEPKASAYYGPVWISCPICSKEHVLIDPSMHGYDGELGQFDVVFDGSYRVSFRCSACENKEFEVAIMLENHQEVELLEGEEKDRPEDFFNSFAVMCRCCQCGSLELFCSIECA